MGYLVFPLLWLHIQGRIVANLVNWPSARLRDVACAAKRLLPLGVIAVDLGLDTLPVPTLERATPTSRVQPRHGATLLGVIPVNLAKPVGATYADVLDVPGARRTHFENRRISSKKSQ